MQGPTWETTMPQKAPNKALRAVLRDTRGRRCRMVRMTIFSKAHRRAYRSGVNLKNTKDSHKRVREKTLR